MAPRKSAKKKHAEDNGQISPVQNHFKDLMDGCTYEWIDPHDCIPFTMIRPVSDSGVLKLMDLFDGAYHGESINGGGISCGSDTSIVVKLDGTLLVHVCEYFRKKGYSETKVKERLNSRKAWYGIVDGEHSHTAILLLIETRSRWTGYKWFVTVIKSGFNIERYRQLARMQNERHSNRFHIETTFFDMISNMKTEYDKLCKVQSRVEGQDIVNAYCGYTVTSKKNSTLVQTANTVIRLPASVIKVIGEVSNSEHPDLILENNKLNHKGVTSIDEALRQVDCRVYRKFLHVTSLKSAKAFMNAKHSSGEIAQVYTIYRVQDLYRQRCFSKAIQPDELGKQYELSLYSMEEEQKFLKYITPDDWPEEMETVRQNLLKTVQLSDEVLLNHGNKEVLPCLLTSYKRHLPAKYIEKQAQLELANQRTQISSDSTKINSPSSIGDNGCPLPDTECPSPCSGPTAEASSNGDGLSDGVKSKEAPSESNGLTRDTSKKITLSETKKSKLDLLKDKGINCHNMKWEEFLKEVWSVNEKRLDAIITEPPPSPSLSFIQSTNRRKEAPSSPDDELSSTDIVEVVKGGKRLLKSGGYFIVLIDFELFQEWYLAFKNNGFNVMRRPLTFSYKPDSLPRYPSQEGDFPYGLEEHCIVARLPGAHPDGFNPNFSSNFNLIECNWSRRASIVTNVDLPKNKLCFPNSRKPVRVSEKSVNLLAEIIDLFVPPYGTTMDICAGTMTLPIAALKTSRRCIAVEKDKSCFDIAIDRLTQLCNPVFKFVLNPNSSSKVNDFSTITVDGSSLTKINSSNTKSIESGLASMNNNSALNALRTVFEETSKDMDDIILPRNKAMKRSHNETNIIESTISEPVSKCLKKSNDLEAGETLLLLTNTKSSNDK